MGLSLMRFTQVDPTIFNRDNIDTAQMADSLCVIDEDELISLKQIITKDLGKQKEGKASIFKTLKPYSSTKMTIRRLPSRSSVLSQPKNQSPYFSQTRPPSDQGGQ